MYSEKQVKEMKAKILLDIANGESLKSILENGAKKPEDYNEKESGPFVQMPSRPRVYEWLNPNHSKYDIDFRNNYTQAREDSADLDVEKMEKVVEEVRTGTLDPQQARVIADIHKWTAGRKKPKKYGDKIDHTTNGKDITQQVTVFQMPDNGRDNDIDENE